VRVAGAVSLPVAPVNARSSAEPKAAALEPVAGVARERPGECHVQRLGKSRLHGPQPGRAFVQPSDHERQGSSAAEGRRPSEGFEQDAAQAVDVAAPIEIRLAGRLLGAHVHGATDDGPGVGQPPAPAGGRGPSDPKVGNDRVALFEQDVLGLDVAVDHPVAVGIVERVGYLAREVDSLGGGEPVVPLEALA
jgi:hypothetical protein